MTVKEVLEIEVIKCAVQDNAIVTIFDKQANALITYLDYMILKTE